MNPAFTRIIEILEAVDELGNTLLGPIKGIHAAGSPKYTMSQRWAYERQAGSKTACVICKLLTWGFKIFYPNDPNYDHCSESIKDFPPDLPSMAG